MTNWLRYYNIVVTLVSHTGIRMNFQEWQLQYPEAAAALNAVVVPQKIESNESLSEAAVQSRVRLHAPENNQFLGRNNSGAYSQKNPPTAGTRWGWCNESDPFNKVFKTPDLIGYTRVTVTPEMIGKTVAVFTGFEIKDPNWKLTKGDKRAQAQKSCITKIMADGGIASFITNHSQVALVVRQYYESFRT